MMRKLVLSIGMFMIWIKPAHAQSPIRSAEYASIAYNAISGMVAGGIGALINKPKEEKAIGAMVRGALGGVGGGLVMYAGKRSTRLVSQRRELGFAWLSRVIFNAGNSIAENAAGGKPLFSRWHFDAGFIRLEIGPHRRVSARLMTSTFAGFLFTAVHGRFDAALSLRSGTVVYRTRKIDYAPRLVGSTTGNSVLLSDSIRMNVFFHELFAHEVVHTFQFSEFSTLNGFFLPLAAKWKSRSKGFEHMCRYIYADWNYEAMLLNYFIVQGGHRRGYCSNFLENEAELLSTGRRACP
jgi:hypothetical protein